jgi:NDP-sugar pyrophosphorylase family protein
MYKNGKEATAAADDFVKITAAILAGGKGTRLRKAVADRPKVLAEVNGRPFITYLLDQLSFYGVRHTVLLTGYMGEMVEQSLGLKWKEMRLSYSREDRSLDTAGALRHARSYFKTPLVLVLNGDSIFSGAINCLVDFHRNKNASASILLAKVEDISRYGEVFVDQSGQITAFKEKNATKKEAGWINSGIYLFNRNIIAQIQPEKSVSLEKKIFPELIGHGLYGCRSDGKFIDIGLPETYFHASKMVDDITDDFALKAT